MKLEDYEALPDAMSVAEVQEHTMHVLSRPDAVDMTLAKLEILADRQWHTYELPAPELQSALRSWLISNWISNEQSYLEAVLGLATCFGLDKEFYQQALRSYSGEHRVEFQKNLTMSKGDAIDPWWSIGRRTDNK